MAVRLEDETQGDVHEVGDHPRPAGGQPDADFGMTASPGTSSAIARRLDSNGLAALRWA